MNIHRSAHVLDTRREQRKEATTRSGATAPTERHCADKARHNKREQDKISILRGSQNLPPDWDSPQDMLETLTSLTENCVSNCYQHGTPWQQQGNKEKQNTPKRVETRFKTRQLQHAPRLIGRDPERRPVLQISRFRFTHGICLILPRLQIMERAQSRRLLH